MVKDVTMTALIREPTAPSESVFVSVAASMRWVSPMWRETARARMDASVITPRPPTLMAAKITACPNTDQ